MRNLTIQEIDSLKAQRCSAADWQNVFVEDPFITEAYHDVRFSGQVNLGSAQGSFTCDCGLTYPAGISHATLHNVTVGKGVYIKAVANYISNCDIEDNVFIENVNRITTSEGATFGVGAEVSVLNETGGREVPLYERLSAQSAYMIAMYRHDSLLIRRLQELVNAERERVRGNRGRIAHHARIVNTSELRDVCVGAYATIEGATHLINGTITGSQSDPVRVGANVMAENFIMASGAKVEDGVVMNGVFVGQGTHLTHMFAAHDSLFFANCSCENGEACAIFAGPYTVTMHKSSLLIAGMFSFINAGSGSNQSNHMYKLGPIHQGVVERGSKTTSDSYVLWPARIGPFSLVMGRHVSHPDTSRLPFSYIIENKGRSYIAPGVNLKSVGSIRDAQKWPKRDRRKDTDLLDSINFNLLSPYTISRMMDGQNLLRSIRDVAGTIADKYVYQSMTIEARALDKGLKYYAMAIDKFMGNTLIKRLKGVTLNTPADLRKCLNPTHRNGNGVWVDIGGMLAPESEIAALISDINERRITSLDQLEREFRRIHSEYDDMEWTWVAAHMKEWYGKPVEALDANDIIAIVERWRGSVVQLDRMLYDDARKEFSLVSRVGFGVDGSEERKHSDFENVRGEFDSDPFVKMVLKHIETKTALGGDLIARVQSLAQMA